MRFTPVVHQSGPITQQAGRYVCCYDGRQYVITQNSQIRLGEFQIAVQAPMLPGSKVYFVTSDNTFQYTAGNSTVILNPKADWDQSDSSQLDYIKNKPDLGLYMPVTGGTFTGAVYGVQFTAGQHKLTQKADADQAIYKLYFSYRSAAEDRMLGNASVVNDVLQLNYVQQDLSGTTLTIQD